MNKESRNIYLIDGNSLCYRAYYAIRDLSTSRGVPTNAIYGFINILRKLIREYEPPMLALVFDMKGPTVRHKKYEKYKIKRKPMPDDLADQIPKIKEVIAAYRIPAYQKQGYEADDIIATLAEKAKKEGFSVTIVTNDKDALQLVDEKVRVLSLQPSGDKMYDDAAVREKFGVGPALMVDMMALAGDASDNIPGIKGIGRATAGRLVKEYGSVREIYRDLDRVSSVSLRKKLAGGQDMAELSLELVRLDRKVPVEMDLDRARLGEPDTARLVELFREFEFEKLLREVAPRAANKGRYFVASGEEEVREIAGRMRKQKIVSVSPVAGPGEKRLSGIAFSWREGEACFVPLEGGSPEIPAIVKGVLEDEAVKKTGYDIKEDILTMRAAGIEIRGIAFDVMIADYLIDPSRPKYDLPGIAMRHLGYNISEPKSGLERDEFGQASMDFSGAAAGTNGCERSDVILRLHNVLKDELKEKHLAGLFRDVEMPLVRVLADMEAEGVRVDTAYLKKRSSAMETRLAGVSDRIYDLAGEKFNINSPMQLRTILFDKLGLPVTKRIKTGASTDESVLRKLAPLHDLPAALLEYREMNKLKTAYYDSILGLADEKTGKVHARFNQAVTATGRLSSSEPNLQNIPVKTPLGKEIRRAFVPDRKGQLLLAADYSQIELRILAHLSKDKNLIEAFKKKEDVHRFTASLIFGCSPGEVTDRMRSMAKTVNFGIAYGMSPFGLAKDLEISVEEARKFIDAYFERYKGVRAFIDRTIADAKKRGYVTTLLKRRRYIPEINSPDDRVRGFAERVAVNTPVQGSAADLIKIAMIACHDEFSRSGVRMAIQVHDELVFNVPEDILEETAKKVKRLMEGVMELEVPLEVDVEAGENWMDMRRLAV